MGCASAKHVSTVQNEEEAQKGKNYQNGDVFGDEYRIKPVEEVKYMKNGGEDDQKIAARNQENLEKSASSNVRLKSNKEVPGLVHQPRANMHISESQQEFFRMLDEKIEKQQAALSKIQWKRRKIEGRRGEMLVNIKCFSSTRASTVILIMGAELFPRNKCPGS
ncbi:uncharacterized protein C1orf21 homolog isoform X1 [Carettochelys insculpta]|uniref:uncharacterized protein C1orf21 homolog isoform X1 n=1 Tax=Carettochelys insculpta TaxID=44489 RepID=UPI003EC14421